MIPSVLTVVAVIGIGAAVSAGARSPDGPIGVVRATCGVERWPVKTLTDAKASLVKRTPKTTSVRALTRFAPPPALRSRPRISGVETTVWRVRVPLRGMKTETDGDIHLVIAQPQDPGLTMIVEFPADSCDAGAPIWARTAMHQARAAIVASCGPATGSFKPLSGVATITGVGFFDVLHGQTGVAQNGIELHPALSFANTNCGTSGAPPGPGPPPPPPATTTNAAPPPPPATTAPAPPPPPPPTASNCAPSYPDVCIPPPPPDLDCKDIPYKNFRVIYDVPDPDPHHFDGDHDGVGCES